ncbi:hypothetical protein AGLY_011699 [Aphis glycines]|uniref:Uncharacterized protein n=1 Tax=Aphis glycines TaxID=307491 RepID=A0A6G0TAX8_APHGL|nr:hypothetical protein AGLY_011699 [Aphis glycines]
MLQFKTLGVSGGKFNILEVKTKKFPVVLKKKTGKTTKCRKNWNFYAKQTTKIVDITKFLISWYYRIKKKKSKIVSHNYLIKVLRNMSNLRKFTSNFEVENVKKVKKFNTRFSISFPSNSYRKNWKPHYIGKIISRRYLKISTFFIINIDKMFLAESKYLKTSLKHKLPFLCFYVCFNECFVSYECRSWTFLTICIVRKRFQKRDWISLEETRLNVGILATHFSEK